MEFIPDNANTAAPQQRWPWTADPEPLGGNAIVVLPALDAIIVITRTSDNTRGMHQQTTRLIEDEILPAPACAP